MKPIRIDTLLRRENLKIIIGLFATTLLVSLSLLVVGYFAMNTISKHFENVVGEDIARILEIEAMAVSNTVGAVAREAKFLAEPKKKHAEFLHPDQDMSLTQTTEGISYYSNKELDFIIAGQTSTFSPQDIYKEHATLCHLGEQFKRILRLHPVIESISYQSGAGYVLYSPIPENISFIVKDKDTNPPLTTSSDTVKNASGQEFRRSPLSGSWMYSIGFPVFIDNKIMGAIAVRIKSDTLLKQLVFPKKYEDRGMALVIDKNMLLIGADNKVNKRLGLPPHITTGPERYIAEGAIHVDITEKISKDLYSRFNNNIKEGKNSFESVLKDGKKYIFFHTFIPEMQWHLIFLIEENALFSPIIKKNKELFSFFYIILFTSIFIIYCIFLFYVRHASKKTAKEISTPIQALESITEKAGKQLSKNTITNSKQLHQTLNTVNVMRETLLQQRQESETSIVELTSLQNNFDTMLERLQDQQHAIYKANKKEKRFLYETLHTSSLTGIPNIRSLSKRLENSAKQQLLIAINLDNYDQIRGFYGYHVVEKIIKIIVSEIKREKNKLYTLYHTHQPEFVLVSTTQLSLETARKDLEELLNNKIQNIFNTSGGVIDAIPSDKAYISPSFIYSITKGSSKFVYPRAVKLLEDIKDTEQRFIVEENIADTIYDEYQKNFGKIHLIQQALRENRVIPYFQPICHTKTQEVAYYEVLIRIEDEQGKVFSPGYFLDAAKEGKIYNALSRRLITRSIALLHNNKDLRISINIDEADVQDKHTLQLIKNFIYADKEAAGRICFEILEGGSFSSTEVLNLLDKFQKNRICIAIDDFGTGLSNMQRLLQLGPDIIKIDGSLIQEIDKDVSKQKIVKAILDFARSINSKVTAEFVSNEKILKTTMELGVDYIQGFYVGEPVPFEKLKKMKLNKK